MRIPKPAALFAAILLLFSVLSQSFVSAEEPTQMSPLILITEVQTGGIDNASLEFIELYNPGIAPVDFSGWQLQYMAATGNSWFGKSDLSGTVASGGYYLIATKDFAESRQATMAAGLSANGGHVRILAPGSTNPDVTSWGSAMHSEGAAAIAPAAGMSIQRCMANDMTYVDTDNNSADFTEYLPSPGTGIVCAAAEPETPDPETSETQPQCQGIIFSELLPNPAGADSGSEFVELFNPTDEVINMNGCALRLNDQQYVFGETSIAAHDYLALSDTQTSLSLPNTAGGTLYLLADDIEVATVSYPPSMPDGAVWTWGGERWQNSYTPTPGQLNTVTTTKPCPAGQTRSADTGRCRATTASGNSLTPCKTGQERNPQTNRCRAVAGASTTLTPCKTGQVRNPATNRCRSTATTASALVPCKSGQERNPATNRCRSVTAVSTTLKPCAAGQERNPETNRCRKIATAGATHPVEVKDVASTSKAPIAWWLLGAVGTGAAGYAVYEWRHEILKRISKKPLLHKSKNKTAQ